MMNTVFKNPDFSMIANSHRTTHLPRLAIPSDAGEALAFANYHDRRADLLLSQGRVAQAEAAAHLAFEARTRAFEVRA